MTRVGHHGRVTIPVRPATALAVVAGALSVAALGGGVAAAASCRVVTVQNAVPVGIALDPQQSSVPYGGCVQFTDNAFGPPVTITVAGGYHTTLDYGESTSAKSNYAAGTPGAHVVTADNGTSTAHGRITVGQPPSRSPSPSPSPSRSPAPSHSSAPLPAPQPSSQTTGPRVARSPRRSGGRPAGLPTAAPPPVAPGVSATPGVVPSVAGSPPGPLQSTTPAPVAVAGPLEPPTGRSLGLPAALAALVLIGVGTAVVRVVLAEPAVDDRRSVGGTA
jgi:hypothetical protein